MPTHESQKKARERRAVQAQRRRNRKVLDLGKKAKNKPQNNNKQSAQPKAKKQGAKKSKPKLTQAQEKILNETPVSTLRATSFTKPVSLVSLYRNVHANVQSIVGNLSPGSLGPVASKPARTPGGLAFYLYWAFIDYVRLNGNPCDAVPSVSTLPPFGRHWSLPLAFIYFIQGYLRNRTKTIDINAEFGDLTALVTGNVGVGVPYNATHTQYASTYGSLYPGLNTSGLEWQFPLSAATATVSQIVAIGSELNDLVAKALAGGTMPFDTILSPNAEDGITGYNSPILCANPVPTGYLSAYPFEREMAYLCIDASAPVASGFGTIFEPYPGNSSTSAGIGQDQFVIDAVNILNHMSAPLVDFRGKHGKKLPRNVYKVLKNEGHTWHEFDPIKTLVVCHPSDSTAWIGLVRLIGVVLQCSVGSLTNLAADGTLVNLKKVIDYCLQCYALTHCLDWGWTHYTVPFGLNNTVYCNAITMCKLSGFKDLNVPSVILDWVRSQAYPIVQNGMLSLPTMPDMAISCFANWAGLAVNYLNASDVTWANAAVPNGYGSFLDLTGFGTSALYTAAGITTTVPFSLGARMTFNLNAANAFGVITATNQSPATPIRLTKLAILTYDNYMLSQVVQTLGGYTVPPTNLFMYNSSFPKKGGVGYHAAVNAVLQILNNDNGWALIDWDILDAQVGTAVDAVTFWRAIDSPKIWNAISESDDVPEIYPFRVEMGATENGITSLVDSMKQNNGGVNYQSLLTGMEGDRSLAGCPYKELIAMDHITDSVFINRASPSFLNTNMKNGLILLRLSQSDLKSSYSELIYTQKGDNNIFKPRSLTGFFAFLSGVSGVLHTGANIMNKIGNFLDSVLGISHKAAV